MSNTAQWTPTDTDTAKAATTMWPEWICTSRLFTLINLISCRCHCHHYHHPARSFEVPSPTRYAHSTRPCWHHHIGHKMNSVFQRYVPVVGVRCLQLRRYHTFADMMLVAEIEREKERESPFFASSPCILLIYSYSFLSTLSLVSHPPPFAFTISIVRGVCRFHYRRTEMYEMFGVLLHGIANNAEALWILDYTNRIYRSESHTPPVPECCQRRVYCCRAIAHFTSVRHTYQTISSYSLETLQSDGLWRSAQQRLRGECNGNNNGSFVCSLRNGKKLSKKVAERIWME